MDFKLPPPQIPLEASQQRPDSLIELSGSGPSDASREWLIPFSSWQRHQQKKLFKLNRQRSTFITQVPQAMDTVLDVRKLGLGMSFRKHVLALLQSLLDKIWLQVQDIQMDRLGGAMTNLMFICRPKDCADVKPVLLRIYGEGTDLFFSRERELLMLNILSSMSVGPQLLAVFQNGRFEEYLEETETLKAQDLKDPIISAHIAEQMYDLHSLVGVVPPVERPQHLQGTPSMKPQQNGGPYESEIWDRLEHWLMKVKTVIEELQRRSPDVLRSILEEVISLDQMQREIDWLRSKVQTLGSPIVFSHNDLQCGNILRRTSDGSLLLIDYEYAGYNYRGFDLANHFCEWTADYHSDPPHRLHLDRMPSPEQQLHFIRAYLNARDTAMSVLRKQSLISPGLSPSLSPLLTPEQLSHLRHQDVALMQREIKVFVLASHFMWGLWALVQASQSVIEFDYMRYAEQRFQAYVDWKKKEFK